MTEPEPEPSQSRPFRLKRLFTLMIKAALCVVLLFHVYALLLRFVPVPATPLMMQRAIEGQEVRKDWTPIADMSPYLVYAVIGAEDSRFCSHSGIDFEAVETVLEERKTSGRRRGGSTLTQQTAKNVFFSNGGGWVRKVPETWMAFVIDKLWGKRRVMEIYLNIAEWGDGIFGAEAAAKTRFGKSAKDLTAHEAALLAAVLPSPHKWRLDPPGPYVKKRASSLQARAADVHWGGYGTCTQITPPVYALPKVETKPKDEEETEATIVTESHENETSKDSVEGLKNSTEK